MKITKKRNFYLIIIILAFLVGCLFMNPPKAYYDKDFNITFIKSSLDYNNNKRDDFTDILEGAKKEAKRHPKYKSKYYSGGYPPKTEGVCTDVIWRALKNAGYNLKDLIDEDIKNNINDYPRVANKQDKNIDFRRVLNLKVYFDKYLEKHSNNPYNFSDFQAGDIVIFKTKHIGIISDKRNKKGISYIIHNAGQFNFEEDTLLKWDEKYPISGHYRWNFKGE
ncbi:MAG: DUF1287 domain-containing protein [Bacilli bacterium]